MHDYVIVGGGSAGGVLARRLSEDRGARVLLLAAGGKAERAMDVRTPVASQNLFATERDEGGCTTAPQEHLLARELHWPRGNMLGGSSAVDARIALRGHPADYDAWAAAHGCDGWRYAAVLPYFKRLESNARGASRYHGERGPLLVSDLEAPHPLTQAVVRAAVGAGHPYNADFNAGVPNGAGLHQVTQRAGQRPSTTAAYLRPARGRDNLTVMTDADVRRVEIDGGRAIGVTYEEDGLEWFAEARAEVILCAGAVGSPQLLMRSGLGPAEHLEDRDVTVRADLPGVGQNLQDHLAVPVCRSLAGGRPPSPARRGARPPTARDLLAGPGLAALSAGEASVFFSARAKIPAPDVQLHAAPLLFQSPGPGATKGEAFMLAPALLRPQSTGHLTLPPNAPDGKPVIQPRYGAARADLDALGAGIRAAREIFAQRPFARFGAEELVPGPEKTTDDELRSYVRLEAQTLYHPVGTCAMGTGAETVVDPSLRVRGVEGLRVAGASVMPRIPRGNTNLPTIMIAEKAADLIRGHAPLPPDEEAHAPATKTAT
jgi:choline dehydrogenase